MEYKYTLSKENIEIVAKEMREFAMGGTQVKIRTSDGKIHNEVLISNCMYIVAMRGCKELPFKLEDIVEIYQTNEDINKVNRGGWEYWDKEFFKKKQTPNTSLNQIGTKDAPPG